MNDTVALLEKRLSAFPDADPEFVHCTARLTESHGLAEEVLRLVNSDASATLDSVVRYRLEYCGDIQLYDADDNRIPVPPSRLALTEGMQGILADMKGKALKSYQLAPVAGAPGIVADCNVRLNLGQRAVDLNCYDFAFDLGGAACALGALHCERMSLRDDFRSWSDDPWRAYAVGERVTGVGLVRDHVEADAGAGPVALDIDVAVAVRTAHATYTFARRSWASTDLCVAEGDGPILPFEAGDCMGEMPDYAGCPLAVLGARRETVRLA